MELLKIARIPAITATPETTVFQAGLKMAEARVGAIVIVNSENKVIGIFTERDNIFRVTCQQKDPKKATMAEVMTSPVITAAADTNDDNALVTMIQNRLRYLPVVDNANNIVGLASIRHLLLRRISKELAGLETLAAYAGAGGPG